MRRKLVVANRKMNGSVPNNQAFFEGLLAGTKNCNHADYIVCVPHPYLYQAQSVLGGTNVEWGGQNMSRHDAGPFTGSVSPGMLVEFGCKYVIVGHSERRGRGQDSDNTVGERFQAATKVGLTPIFCMGETAEDYAQGLTDLVTIRQLNAVIQQVGIKNLSKCILAYEPVWAIGTGNAATPEHAQSILHFLRGYLILKDEEVGANIRVLYGGSMNAKNTAEIMAMPDIDGGLIGGASLNTEDFVKICQTADAIGKAQGN